MKDVEEQRLQNVGVLAHRLKIEALEFRERDRVFRVVEQKPELPSTGPFRQAIRHAMTQSVREHTQRAQGRVHGIEVFDLMVEIAFRRRVEFAGRLPLYQDLQEEREEIEIFLGRRERKRVDLESVGLKADAHI